MTDKRKIETLERLVKDLQEENKRLKGQLADSRTDVVQEYKTKQENLLIELQKLRSDMLHEIDNMKQEKEAYQNLMYREFGLKRKKHWWSRR